MKALVTGGASSGKSSYAEDLCLELGGNLVYLAAMNPYGEEGARRVAKHRRQRAGKGFETIECYDDFSSVVDDPRLDGATVLLESLGNVVANELFDGGRPVEERIVEQACARVASALEGLCGRCAHVVVVGDEVGSDGVPYSDETRCYQKLIGILAGEWAQQCDLVVECVSGIPVVLK